MKRISQYTAVTVLVIMASLAYVSTAAAMSHGEQPERHNAISNATGLVAYHGSAEELTAAVSGAGATLRNIWPEIGLAAVSVPGGAANVILRNAPGIDAVVADRNVLWVEKLAPGRNIVVQSDPAPPADSKPESAEFYDIQWPLSQIGVEEAWKAGNQHTTTRVGLLDTGISPDHVDLNGKYDVTASINLSDSDPEDARDFIDRHYHGTYVSAIISSNNFGVAGIAPNVTLVGVKVLDDEGRASFSNLIAGIMYAVDEGRVDIINLSFGARELDASYAPLIEMLGKAVSYAGKKGVMIVASAGNDARSLEGGIALLHESASNVVLVGATGQADVAGAKLACYSNYGDGVTLSAPGGIIDCSSGSFRNMSEMVISALSPAVARAMQLRNPDSWYVFSTGTEVAACHVTGVAAMLQSAACGRSPVELIARLQATARGAQIAPVGSASRQLAEVNASLALHK